MSNYVELAEKINGMSRYEREKIKSALSYAPTDFVQGYDEGFKAATKKAEDWWRNRLKSSLFVSELNDLIYSFTLAMYKDYD